jgi:hypothetical protein
MGMATDQGASPGQDVADDERVVLARMAAAHQTLDDARASRAALIRARRQEGVRPADIARRLRTTAERLGYTREQIEAFGISESSIRLTLKLAEKE